MNISQNNAKFKQVMGDNKHVQHAMKSNKSWWRDRLKMQFGFDIWQLPVCERCEGYALWHKEGGNPVGLCRCGHTTKNPITVEQYYEKGHHVDRTMHGDAPVVIDRQLVSPSQVATAYGGEAGLSDQNKKIIIARR